MMRPYTELCVKGAKDLVCSLNCLQSLFEMQVATHQNLIVFGEAERHHVVAGSMMEHLREQGTE